MLGVFTERRTIARVVRLDPGATLEATGRSIYFVTAGEGTVEGQPFRRLTTVYVNRGEQARFAAQGPAEMLHLGLPDLSGIATGTHLDAVAAE
jgi:hypothetical protein